MKRVLLTALVVLCFLSAVEGDAATRFTSADCHVCFEIPRKWQVTVLKHRSEALCIISVDPPNQKELVQNERLRLNGLTVEVTVGPFEEALEHDGGFEEEGGKWYVLGRQGIRSAAYEVTQVFATSKLPS